MGTTIPSWIVWVPVIGTLAGGLLGGIITYLVTARTSRIGVRGQVIGQWISEVRKIVIELTGDLDAAHSKLKKGELTTDDRVRIMKHTTTLSLYLNPARNALHSTAIEQISHVVDAFSAESERDYVEELGHLTVMFREVIAEEFLKVENEVSFFWQRKKKRNKEVKEALERYTAIKELHDELVNSEGKSAR
jgi:hypothetical protein